MENAQETPDGKCPKCFRPHSIRIDPINKWVTTLCGCGCLIEYLKDSQSIFEALAREKNGHATFVPKKSYQRMDSTDKFQGYLVNKAERYFGRSRQ